MSNELLIIGNILCKIVIWQYMMLIFNSYRSITKSINMSCKLNKMSCYSNFKAVFEFSRL